MGEIAKSLFRLLERGSKHSIEHDPQWASPAEILPPDEKGYVRWRPVPMDLPAEFTGVGLHPDLRELHGSLWGGSAEGRHSGETVLVRAAWNAADLARIERSLRRQVAMGEPVFVAGTLSDRFFAADNATGTVWLCEPGRPPIREVAPSIAEFLAGVQ